MPATVAAEQAANHVAISRKHFQARRWWILGALAVVACLVIYATVLILNWPFTEQAVIDVLQERSVRSVTIDHFRRTYWPPGCVAEGISFLHRQHKNKPPLITIRKLVIQGSYARLLTVSRSLSKVVVVGMHVTVPPKQPDGKPNPIMPLTQSNSGPSIVIGRVIADGAILDFLPGDPKKQMFRVTIDRLALDGVGNNRALSYEARLNNKVPTGKITSRGVFGPWNADDPASTPVSGSYQYENANLGVFKAISGTLSAKGKFSGNLGHIEVTGSTDVPNFHLADTSHTRQLTAEFQAAVDATDGNTTLEIVTAHFGQTTVLFKGGVIGQLGENGKTVSLDMYTANGRIEDLLNLFIAARNPPMTGSVSFRAHVEVPPAAEEFVKKMKLTGEFGVDAGRFTDKDTQGTINRLSDGSKKMKAQQEDAETVLSDLKGHVAAKDGIATLSNLSFAVPGATAQMHGTYGLVDPYAVNLHGQLLTHRPSDATTGFKSFLLKTMTPFLKKKDGEKVVPFKITGNYQKIEMGLDAGSKK